MHQLKLSKSRYGPVLMQYWFPHQVTKALLCYLNNLASVTPQEVLAEWHMHQTAMLEDIAYSSEHVSAERKATSTVEI